MTIADQSKGKALLSQWISKWVSGCIRECYKWSNILPPDSHKALYTGAGCHRSLTGWCVLAGHVLNSGVAICPQIHNILCHRTSSSYRSAMDQAVLQTALPLASSHGLSALITAHESSMWAIGPITLRRGGFLPVFGGSLSCVDATTLPSPLLWTGFYNGKRETGEVLTRTTSSTLSWEQKETHNTRVGQWPLLRNTYGCRWIASMYTHVWNTHLEEPPVTGM